MAISEEQSESYGYPSNDHPNLIDAVSPSLPLSPGVTIPLLHKDQGEKKELLPASLEYISYLVHLAVFGILGALTRNLLQKLFGPRMMNVTSDGSILYLDLPSNMVGSFLMGWFGIMIKGDISRVSDQLAVGLSTGYLGSLTTFSGWNQKMLELSVDGHWIFAFLGFVIGLFLCAYCIIFGVETATGFRWLLSWASSSSSNINVGRLISSSLHRLILLIAFILTWVSLWTTSGILVQKEFKNGGSVAQLWLGCLVAPFGVWIRWWLSRFNGRALGVFDWIPMGTLIANISAACIMAALATMKKYVNTQNCDTIATGIQFGMLGCLSTVSTLMAEFHSMRQSNQPWKAYAYVIITIGISFGLGTLIYSVPVWTNMIIPLN